MVSAAARITARPIAVEPVNSRWSNGSAQNACATSGPPVTTATSSGSKRAASSCPSRAAVRGVSSDGFSITRLPAASASISGPIDRNSG